jgi:DNA-nicking Smr family endonuclease
MLASMGKRHSDPETDEELWARVARGARPLKKGASARPVVPAKPRAKPGPKSQAVTLAPKPRPKPAPAARNEALDRQTARRLERGRVAVEARLDLHGMRQREAHAALRKFLKWAVAKDYRHVLVITGKGAEPDAWASFYKEEARGVLRASVPRWLAAPDLAHIVLSYSEAPRRLGGEGALYVRLRRKKT